MSFVDYRALTWPEAGRLADAGPVLGVVGLAALEQHGPHLPLATDSLIAEVLGRRLADRFLEPVVVMPVPYGGLSDHHLGFPGTVSFGEAALRGIVDAYIDGLARLAIRDILVFTSHGGNFGFLSRLAADYRGRRDVRLAVYDDRDRYFGTTFAGASRAGLEPLETDWHAGGIETSQGLWAFPELVRDFGDVAGYTAAEDGWLDRVLGEGLHAVSSSGVLGSPAGATAQAGKAIFDALVDELAAFVDTAFESTFAVQGA